MKRKKLPILITTLCSLFLLSGCKNQQSSKSTESVPQYRTKLADKYTKRAHQALKKSKINDAALYFDLAKEQGKKSNPLQKSLSAWLQASNLERDGKYEAALKMMQEIAPTKDRQFNQILDSKITSLKQIVQNQQKYQQSYQSALGQYQKKNYQIAIEQLKTLLRDPAIKQTPYHTIFGQIHDLLLTATIDLANANLAAQTGRAPAPAASAPGQSTNSNASSQNADSSGSTSKESPKLSNGKQVNANQIEQARKQIDALKAPGIKSSFFSGPDIVKIINIAQKNHHQQITKADLEQFLNNGK